MDKLSPYYKAVVAFLAPGAVCIIAAVTDVSAGGAVITAGEWITAVCTMIVTGAGVYQVPNLTVKHKQPPLLDGGVPGPGAGL